MYLLIISKYAICYWSYFVLIVIHGDVLKSTVAVNDLC